MVVQKYVILAYSNDETFDIPRQLVEINGEPILKRTIRLLRENGVENIIVTGKDKRYKELGVKVYNSKSNDFDYIKRTGYWLNAFNYELMNEPVCFIWGDVYFSEEAIKTIVETDTDSTLFFCSYNNKCDEYIKEHDEPFAYKIVDTELFKEHNERVKRLYDEGKTCRHPIVWEVYRSINGLDVNEHKMTDNFVAINDITCDIDSAIDVDKINEQIRRRKMIKAEVIEGFTFSRFNELVDLKRGSVKNEKGSLYVGDTFKCEKDIADYLLKDNAEGRAFIKVIGVEPKKEIIIDVPEPQIIDKKEKKEYNKAPKKRSKKGE